jgi:L-lysine exporter family protein LysE/ArgO
MAGLLDALATGFGIGFSLIVAIGPQNAYVLRLGLARRHVLPIVLFCSVSDATLIAAGVGGLGQLIGAYATLAAIIGAGGAAFLFVYGILAFRRALHPDVLLPVEQPVPRLRTALATCAAFTWGNPHVYLDTVLLVGSLSLPFHGWPLLGYGAGACLASFVWFFGLGFGARLLTPLFRRRVTWRILDGLIGIVMWSIALRLAMDLAQLPRS